MAAPGSDLGWMTLQLDVLFESDAAGRLLRSRAAGSGVGPPPRFFLGRTRHGHLWRFGAGVPPACVRDLARLAALERATRPLDEPPERLEAIRARLALDAPVEKVFHGPAFRFPGPVPGADAGRAASLRPGPGTSDAVPGVVSLTPDRVDLLHGELPALAAALAARQPCAAVLEGGRVVSACWVAARSERAAEAGVETLPGHRGRGFGARAALAWARAVADAGLLPLYSTEWTNRASRALAARLGLILYGVDLHLR